MSKGIKRKVLVYSLVSHYIAYVSHDFTNLPPGHHNEPDTLLNCTHITTTAIIPAATEVETLLGQVPFHLIIGEKGAHVW